ncbi:unnamed protein product [marine sediment metagenome]|uniref:Uncharacterized protein n=1 Tax=marine sediment metagenome TaxID=412755 RepID=X1RHC8_9ZZZZ
MLERSKWPEIRKAVPMPVYVVPHTALQDLDLQEKSLDHTTNITIATAVVLAANKFRTCVEITNDSDVVIYLRLGQDAVLNTGIRLNASGGAYEINLSNLWKGPISAIHGGTGNKVLCIMEIETRYAY